MLKVTDIEPIWAKYVPIYSEEDLKDVVELPLLNACKDLFRKNIRTIMSSCNKFNIIGLDKYAEDKEEGQNMKFKYSYGEHYAWIMIDYDSLSEENKSVLANYRSQQEDRFLYSIKYDDALKDSSLDFKENYKESLYTPHHKDRIIVMRYPLSKDTTGKEVNDYFVSITSSLKPQKEELDRKEEERYKLFELANKYKKQLEQLEIYVDNTMFKDPLFKIPNTPKERLYGLKEESSVLWTLFILATLDNFHLLEEQSALMILSTNRNDIHIMYNGKEYRITSCNNYPEEQILRFGRNGLDYESLQREKELIDLFRKFDYFDYLYTQETKIAEELNRKSK